MSASLESPHPAPVAPPRRRRWLWRVLVALAVLVGLALLAVAWLLTTSQGARFALDQAVRMSGGGLRYEGLEGSFGGTLRVRLIEVNKPQMYARVDDVVLETSPLKPLRGELDVHRLAARSVEVRTVDTGEAAKIPASFAPPYHVRLHEGRIGSLRLGELTKEAAAEQDPAKKRALMDASRGGDVVVNEIHVRGEGSPKEWHIAEASALTEQGRVTLAGRLESAAPFALDLRATLQGKVGERAYRASVAATGTLKAIEAALEGELSGQPARGRLVVEPFATMPIREVELHARDVDLSRHAEGPRTRLHVDVKLAGEGKAFAGPVRLENAEPGPWDKQRIPFTSASARVIASAEQVEVRDLAVALAGGGSAAGQATLRKSGAQADLVLSRVDLAALHGSLQATQVSGRLAVSGDKATQAFELDLKDPRFGVAGRGILAGEKLTLETATVRTGGGSVTGAGHVVLAGDKPFRFEGRARNFDPAAFVRTSRGDLNFDFVAVGSLPDGPAGELQLAIAPSRWAGLPANGKVVLAGDKRRIARADVSLAVGEARIDARGSFGRAGDSMDIAVNAPSLSALARPFNVALAGRVDAKATLTGTFQAPAGRIELTGANLVLPGNVQVREVSLRAAAGTDPASRVEARVDAAGILLGDEQPPTRFADRIEATLEGTRAQHRLQVAATMTREASLSAVLAGGLDPRARELAWNGRIESLSMTGRGAFSLQQPAALHVSAARIELGDAQLRGEWGEARMHHVRWTPRSLELKGSTPGIEIQNLARSFRLGPVPRSNLVIAGDFDVRGLDTFNGTVNLRRVSGDLRVGDPALDLGLQVLELKAEAVRGQARASLRVVGERIGRIEGEGTGSIVRGKAGWEFAATAPIQARLVAVHTNLEALAPWLGPDARLGGRLDANVTVSGTGAEPRVSGEARATQVILREPASGFEVERGEIAVRLAGQSLTIERFEAVTPWRPAESARQHFAGLRIPAAGRISAEGGIDLRARKGRLTIKADQAVLTQSPTRFLAVTGEARLEQGDKAMVAVGNFRADAGWIGALEASPPTISEDVVVVRAAQPAAEQPREKTEAIRIDARFNLGDHLYFEGRGLDTRLVGEIAVSGPPTALRAVGTIRTASGTYNGYGQKLTIERGVLRFAGPVENPQLNVLALRKGLPVEAGVEVMGTVSRPRVRLVSYPDVPDPEKLSWLVLGRGPSELAPGDASVLLSAATSMLGRNNPGSDLGKKLGLDEVRIGRADANSILGVLPQSTVAGKTGSPSAAQVVSVGKKLTRNVHLTYEQGLGDAEGALRIAWQITQRFQLIVRAGFLPGLDAVYRWSLD